MNLKNHLYKYNLIYWCIIAVLLTLIVRFPGFEHEVINWDESTFALTASDLTMGNLPYEFTLDNKPPILSATIALGLLLFGKSIISVRIVGLIFVFITALFIFLIARKYYGIQNALISSLTFVAMTGVDYGLYTSAEIIAIGYLMGSLWLILNFAGNNLIYYLSGVLMSLAVLVRTNLAFTAIAGVLYFVFVIFTRQKSKLFFNALSYSLGGATPVLVMFGIYLYNHKLNYMKLGMIDIPLSYSDSKYTLWGLILRHGYLWLKYIYKLPFIAGPITIILIIALFFLIKSASKFNFNALSLTSFKKIETKRINQIWFAAVFISIVVSILKSGNVYAHYQIQIYPFIAVYYSLAISLILNKSRLINKKLINSLFLIMVVSNLVLIPKAIWIATHIDEIESNFPGRIIADIILKDLNETDKVLAFEHHIVLLYLDRNPIIPLMTHPSNLTRETYVKPLIRIKPEMLDPFSVILSSQPKYIIINRSISNNSLTEEQNILFRKFVKEEYLEIYQNLDSLILKRKSYH